MYAFILHSIWKILHLKRFVYTAAVYGACDTYMIYQVCFHYESKHLKSTPLHIIKGSSCSSDQKILIICKRFSPGL